MATKNKTQYAILGILSIGPGSGYDIKKYCDTVISNIWNENFGHIYPVLNTLLQDGFIQKVEGQDTSRKIEYEITAKGRESFLTWLMEPTQIQPVRSEFMLKFLFSNHLPKDGVITLLTEYKSRHERKLLEYQKMEEYLNSDQKEITTERKIYMNATLRYGFLGTQASITWCEEVIHAFQELC
jgi:DNA-binding PadR family transcriptional regulator